MDRRRFLKSAGATAAVVGASALGLDYLTSNQRSLTLLTESTSRTPTTQTTSEVLTTESITTQASSTSISGEFVKLQGDKFLYQNQLYTIKGFNYYPKEHAWRIFRDWDKDEVDYELQLGSSIYANSIRTFINYQHSTDNVDYQYDWRTNYHVSASYLENIEAFLALADRHGLKVILSLFDWAFWELFTQNEGQSVAEAYLGELIPKFSNDPRVMAWDVMNQPDVTASLVGANGKRDLAIFLQRISNEIKRLDMNHPITICFGDPSNPPVSNIWNDLLAGVQPSLDFLSFQNYAPPDKLSACVRELRKFMKPIVTMEFGRHTWSQDPQDPSDEMMQEQYYASVLRTMKNENISGSMFWTLMDFPVEHNSCNLMCFPVDKGESRENHFGVYRTDYSPKPARDIVKQHYSQ